MFGGSTVLVATWGLVALSVGRGGYAQVSVQATVDVERRPLVVLADHEDSDLLGRGKADKDAPLAGSGQVDATDPLDLLAGQPVLGSLATTVGQVSLHAFHAAADVRADTPYVLFSDTGPEDIEANGQLVGRLWT
jgi:hypothetical protein